ncbi:MAG: zf-HC2 domain-containing protein [Lachnospiraceae bacterium]|nr:zf-HC2 domain-containing protein [Lachnospiraceae bacterium]
MTCLEAQSNIMAFIEHRLPDDQVEDFVRHMKYCPNCFEELEIYYTLIVGMRQLDDNTELSHNFTQDLNDELNKLTSKVKTAKRFKISSFGVVFAVAVALLVVFYNHCLSKVYNIEQVMLKQSQGNEFFYEYFSDYIDFEDRDIVVEMTTVPEIAEPTFYDIVHYYNMKHVINTDTTDEDTE